MQNVTWSVRRNAPGVAASLVGRVPSHARLWSRSHAYDSCGRCSARRTVGLYGGSGSSLPQLVGAITSGFPNLKLGSTTLHIPATDARRGSSVCGDRRGGGANSVRRHRSASQDLWMHAHQGRIQAVMLGVGAAFDFLARTKPAGPQWMQRMASNGYSALCRTPSAVAALSSRQSSLRRSCAGLC